MPPEGDKNNICNIGNIIKLKIASNFSAACIIFGVYIDDYLGRLDTDTQLAISRLIIIIYIFDVSRNWLGFLLCVHVWLLNFPPNDIL